MQRGQQNPKQTLTAGTIDHTAFPHIINAILSDPVSWLPMRATSREYRSVCDRLLYSHVRLEYSQEAKKYIFRRSAGRGARVSRFEGITKLRLIGGIGPPPYNRRITDLRYSLITLPPRLARSLASFIGLTTRYIGYSSRNSPVYIDMPANIGNMHSTAILFPRTGVHCILCPITLLPQTEVVIFNVDAKICDGIEYITFRGWVKDSDDPEDEVLAVTAIIHNTTEPTCRRDREAAPPLYGLARILAELVRPCRVLPVFQVVNHDSAGITAVDIEELRAALCLYVAILGHSRNFSEVKKWAEDIVFDTLEEYKDRISPELYELYTNPNVSAFQRKR